jgi:hypothetical protein
VNRADPLNHEQNPPASSAVSAESEKVTHRASVEGAYHHALKQSALI